MAKDFTIEQLKKYFLNRESFSREELFHFYRQLEPDLKEPTFRWRIHQLKDKKIIRPLSRYFFTLSYKPSFKPLVEETERKLYQKIEKQFPELKLCIWSTRAITEFMLHLPGKFLTIIEVEKDAISSVFNHLRDTNTNNIFLQPDEKEIEYYLYKDNSTIILQSLVSKAPLQRIRKINTITLEKLLVDLFCDRKLLIAFQGTELIHIINNAYERYAIDFTKLFNYAKRRRKETELMGFLSNKTDIPKSILND